MAPKNKSAPATILASSASTSATQPRTVTAKTYENKSSPSSSKTTTTTTSAKPASLRAQDFPSILQHIYHTYRTHTPQRVKLIDTFLAFLLTVGVFQFAYCVLAGNYPFNAFLSGFGATVGQFVLTASLRIQTNVENQKEFEGVSHERAFADFVFGSLILHFFCVNFIN